MRTNEGLIIESAGPISLLKSRALSGWKKLKWRSESCTTHTTEPGSPLTSITALPGICSEEAAIAMEEESKTSRRNAHLLPRSMACAENPNEGESMEKERSNNGGRERGLSHGGERFLIWPDPKSNLASDKKLTGLDFWRIRIRVNGCFFCLHPWNYYILI